MNVKEEIDKNNFLLYLMASIIKGNKGYEWIPALTKYGTNSIVLIFNDYGYYVACKIITEPIDERKIRSFLREIMRTLKAQGHPLIARVIDITLIGADTVIKPRPAIFMHYYEKNLREYILEKGKLPIGEALALAIQIVKGLIYLKHRGFAAHQDLKPENILLEDIRKIYGKEKLPPELYYRPRISDFGLANAFLEAGIARGSNPYRAPEQFIEGFSKEMAEKLYEAKLFNPDVFALGTILTEMLTGKHPSGYSSSEVMKQEIAGKTKFWHEWSINKENRIVDVENKDLKELILKMLDPDPRNRPSLEEIYKELMRILKDINPDLHDQIEVILEYYDMISKGYEESLGDIDRFRLLLNLSRLSEAKKFLEEFLNDLKQRLKDFTPPKDPEDLYKHLRIWHTIGEVLLAIDVNKYKDEVRRIGIENLDIVVQWISKIKSEHCPYKSVKLTDDETREIFLEEPINLLKRVMSEQEIDEIVFSRYDNYIKALYLSLKASSTYGNYEAALHYINEALKYSPDNKTLLFFRALYKYHYGRKLMIFESKDRGCDVLKEAINELEILSKQETTWEEPRRWLEEVKEEYETKCQH